MNIYFHVIRRRELLLDGEEVDEWATCIRENGRNDKNTEEAWNLMLSECCKGCNKQIYVYFDVLSFFCVFFLLLFFCNSFLLVACLVGNEADSQWNFPFGILSCDNLGS